MKKITPVVQPEDAQSQDNFLKKIEATHLKKDKKEATAKVDQHTSTFALPKSHILT